MTHLEQSKECTCASFFTVRGEHKKDCPCHSSKEEVGYEHATPEEKQRIGEEVGREAIAEQRKIMDTQPEWVKELEELFNGETDAPIRLFRMDGKDMKKLRFFIRRLLESERAKWDAEERENDLTFLKKNSAGFEEGVTWERTRIIELVRGMRTLEVPEVPQGYPKMIGYNRALNDILSTLEDNKTKS